MWTDNLKFSSAKCSACKNKEFSHRWSDKSLQGTNQGSTLHSTFKEAILKHIFPFLKLLYSFTIITLTLLPTKELHVFLCTFQTFLFWYFLTIFFSLSCNDVKQKLLIDIFANYNFVCLVWCIMIHMLSVTKTGEV